ncbi:PRAME family member 12-like [Erinaceus europaeus]|uniref:PRAME family member 12-like n=1 Tax=Erinaceus europaeus TaxID=9365 RepID=A0ABM3YBA5_ERIEU|nr:PRAME family member 12-like [Erinaceus europaeus]
MSYAKPPSLLQLAIRSLLRDEELAISSLKDLPTSLFPCLLLEAHSQECWETLKALVQTWPFESLPLGALINKSDKFPSNPCFKAVMDGLDILLKQKVSSRCELQVLDLSNTGQTFWNMRAGADLPVHSEKRDLIVERPSRQGNAKPCLEVLVDLDVLLNPKMSLYQHLLNWAHQKEGVHICCKKLKIFSLGAIHVHNLKDIPLDDTQELEIDFFWPTLMPQNLKSLLTKTKNLRRLCLNFSIPDEISASEWEKWYKASMEFISDFSHLLHLQELYLESPSFLQGHLNEMLRYLNTPLEVFSLTNCTLTEEDLTDLFQSPHITHLKDLCLRGVPLTSVSEPLRALLEVNAVTLQDLDLGLCGLQDPQIEALLPALSSCSQLISLSLHGNSLSIATLEKLLRCTSGLEHLCLQLFPAPLESFSLQPVAFDLLCTQISKVIKDIGHPRSIMVSTSHCSTCAKKLFIHGEPKILPCLSCADDYKKLSF